jgi:hypothetical protein
METAIQPAAVKTPLPEIKAVLGSHFPSTRFRYSLVCKDGYRRIIISYLDGASLTRVKNAVRGFNLPAHPSMHRPRTEVVVERDMSDRVRGLLLSEIKSVFGLQVLPRESDPFSPIGGTVGDYMLKIFHMRDFE